MQLLSGFATYYSKDLNNLYSFTTQPRSASWFLSFFTFDLRNILQGTHRLLCTNDSIQTNYIMTYRYSIRFCKSCHDLNISPIPAQVCFQKNQVPCSRPAMIEMWKRVIGRASHPNVKIDGYDILSDWAAYVVQLPYYTVNVVNSNPVFQQMLPWRNLSEWVGHSAQPTLFVCGSSMNWPQCGHCLQDKVQEWMASRLGWLQQLLSLKTLRYHTLSNNIQPHTTFIIIYQYNTNQYLKIYHDLIWACLNLVILSIHI